MLPFNTNQELDFLLLGLLFFLCCVLTLSFVLWSFFFFSLYFLFFVNLQVSSYLLLWHNNQVNELICIYRITVWDLWIYNIFINIPIIVLQEIYVHAYGFTVYKYFQVLIYTHMYIYLPPIKFNHKRCPGIPVHVVSLLSKIKFFYVICKSFFISCILDL